MAHYTHTHTHRYNHTYTLHSTLYTLHTTPYTLHLTHSPHPPHTLHTGPAAPLQPTPLCWTIRGQLLYLRWHVVLATAVSLPQPTPLRLLPPERLEAAAAHLPSPTAPTSARPRTRAYLYPCSSKALSSMLRHHWHKHARQGRIRFIWLTRVCKMSHPRARIFASTHACMHAGTQAYARNNELINKNARQHKHPFIPPYLRHSTRAYNAPGHLPRQVSNFHVRDAFPPHTWHKPATYPTHPYTTHATNTHHIREIPPPPTNTTPLGRHRRDSNLAPSLRS